MNGRNPIAGRDAVHQAREVVGLYGDPDTTWGIAAEFLFQDPLDVPGAAARLAALCEESSHLGVPPPAITVAADGWAETRASVASRPYDDDGRLLRVCFSEDARTILVGAHHGTVDGLGLVAVAAAATGRELMSSARGIGERRSTQGFLRSSVRRVREALWSPPARFPGEGSGIAGPDELQLTEWAQSLPLGTAALGAASLGAFGVLARAAEPRDPLLLIGASRREPGRLAADRQTAYLRLRADQAWGVAEVRRALHDLDPEPDFPETSARGLGPRVTHLLRGRLGATALISNLGVISGPGLLRVHMFPATSGPRAVAMGLASTSGSTTLTLRTRPHEFTRAEAERLLAEVGQRFGALAP